MKKIMLVLRKFKEYILNKIAPEGYEDEYFHYGREEVRAS